MSGSRKGKYASHCGIVRETFVRRLCIKRVKMSVVLYHYIPYPAGRPSTLETTLSPPACPRTARAIAHDAFPCHRSPPFPVAMMARLSAAQEEEMSSYRATLAQVHERERERREQEKRDLEKRNKDLPPIPESPFVRPDSQVLVHELRVTKAVSESRAVVAQENKSPFENETPPPTPLPKSPRDYRNPFASRENLPESQSSIKSSIPSKGRPQRPYQNMGWLNEQFPHVAPHLILKVVRHELEPMDLARLDPDQQNAAFEHGCFWTDYLTIESLVAPLAVYFRILQSWVAATSRDDSEDLVSQCALEYIAHLRELNEHYEWVFVLQYHMSFHEMQRRLMRRGEYEQWNVVDMDLVHKFLEDNPRPRQPSRF